MGGRRLGQLGRLAVGSRIVRIDGGAAGFRHAFIRALVGVIEIVQLWLVLGTLERRFPAEPVRDRDAVRTDIG